MALQQLRSSTANKRPTAGAMSDGQLAVNTNATNPGLFFKDADGSVRKVGPVFIGSAAPNASPASGGSTGHSVGEQWLDNSGGTYVLKIWDGTAWRSESGTFVDVSGDNMTGNLTLGTDKVVLDATSGAATLQGPIKTRQDGSSALAFAVTQGGTANGDATIRFDGDGSASFAGQITSGADAFATANTGSGLTSTGSVIARRSGTGSVWLGYQTGTSVQTSTIKADGSALFAGNTQVGDSSNGVLLANNGAVVANTTDTSSNKKFILNSAGTETFSVSANGSALFAGGAAEFKSTGELQIDRTNAANTLLGFYLNGSNTGFIKANGSATFNSTVKAQGSDSSYFWSDRTNSSDYTFRGSLNNTNTALIYADGSAEFADNVEVGNPDPSSSSSAGVELYKEGLVASNVSADGNSAIVVKRGNSVNMRVKGDGSAFFASSVGIGTINPAALLEVHGDTPALTLRDTSSYVAGTGPQINFQGKDSNGLNKNLASINGVSRSSNNGELAFKTRVSGNTYERVRIDERGRLLVGTNISSQYTGTTSSIQLTSTDSTNGPRIQLKANATTDAAAIDFGGGNQRHGIIQAESGGLTFFSNSNSGTGSVAQRVRIDSAGNIGLINGHIDTTSGSSARCYVNNSGFIYIARSGGPVALFNRNTSDGDVVLIRQGNSNEGSISVSGTDVTLNGATLSRWSQLAGGAERIEILRGSVLSNLDEMCEWGDEDNEQLNRMKISDVEGDINVAGVFRCWDDDDDTYTNDFYCAMTGDFVIRIAQGTTVARGDLLMSAGDGTAKPQDDDIVRSKTIAKVTSTTVSATYSDGSYCVPCVLMAC